MEEKVQQRATFNKDIVLKLIFSTLLSVFWVVFFWNVWDREIYVLGFNAFVFLMGFIGLFIWMLVSKKKYNHKDLLWIIPIILITISFLLYDNPFIKIVTMLVLPVSFIVFYNYAMLEDKAKRKWDLYFGANILKRVFKIVGSIGKSATLYLEPIIPVNRKYKKIISKVLFGVIIFLIIALTIFIPLLSSADSKFGDMMQVIYNWIQELLSLPFIYRIIVAVLFSIVIFATVLAWSKRFNYQEKTDTTGNVDDIIAGIVLGGMVILYLLFLWVQINRLWVGELPFDFKETENLVKSGFWQLFVLTLLNILIFFFIYKKTKGVVQSILILFTISSLLLLVSAGYRMGLYVIFYGFSYEKFFASYTVLFCAILLLWLIARLFIEKKVDIIKFVAILFIWMFGLVSILPMEQFILRSNVALSQRESSRIRLFELTMLSPDVLGLIKQYQKAGALDEPVGYLSREDNSDENSQFDWTPWIDKQEARVADKEWYELNYMNIKYRYFK